MTRSGEARDSIGRRRFPLLGVLSRIILPGIVLLLVGGCATVKPAFSDAEVARSCQATIEEARGNSGVLEAALDRRIEKFQSVAEQLFAAREEAIQATRRALALAPPGHPLPPVVMDDLRRSMQRGLAAMEPMDRLVFGNLCWLDAGEGGDPGWQKTALPPGIRIKGVALSLAGMLMLYDTYAATGAILSEDERVRAFLDTGDAGYGMPGGQFHDVTRSMMSLRNLSIMQEEMVFFDGHWDQAEAMAADDKGLSYLMLVIEQSPSKAYLRRVETDEALRQRLESGSDRIADNLRRLGHASTGGLSRIFGNTAGIIEIRSGRLAGNPVVRARVEEAIRPGDILVEKTPFRLTDKLIPGYFGHLAIWLGTEAQLRKLRIWDEPLAAAHREALRDGRRVVEALRSGVQLNTLEHFLNVDDLLVLRDPELEGDRLREHLIRALRQVGKPYDFNFDVGSSDRVACAELVFLVFTDIPWEAPRRLGRYTISPDRVVDSALSRGGLEIVLLYLDGEPFEGDAAAELRARMARSGAGDNSH